MKSQFKNRELIACMELHTFSSLNANFLEQYNGCMEEADIAIVYFSKEAIKHKRLTPISENQVKASFRKENLIVFTDSNKLTKHLQSINLENRNLLMMSSGTFEEMKMDSLS